MMTPSAKCGLSGKRMHVEHEVNWNEKKKKKMMKKKKKKEGRNTISIHLERPVHPM
jgi:hypothetical protein